LRERGRGAEAEVLGRAVVADHPRNEEARALLGAVLADLGRDAEARRQLERLDLDQPPLGSALLAAEIAAAVYAPSQASALLELLAPRCDTFAGWHGAVARHAGLLCHVLGRWDEAEERFAAALGANQAAGAPVVVAHTCRQYSALLRVRGRDGDWERAIDLLAQAAGIYRRLEIDPLADQVEAVLRRSHDLAGDDGDPAGSNAVRRTPAGWELEYGGRRAVVADTPGMGYVAILLAAEGRPVHAMDLVGARDHQAEAEYRARLVELEAQLADPDPVAAALARAERDFVRAELAVVVDGRAPASELGDRARRLAALRIRTALDDIDQALPDLARHLRHNIRPGTFCLYQPPRPRRWTIGP
ncbi:MAG: hypothetical protein M3203_03440, partial [Actinomycetota bacterium]|nr:hypothetical protein [Actinomycetota bacterium]